MKEKEAKLLGSNFGDVLVTTFHDYTSPFLKGHPDMKEKKSSYVYFGEDHSMTLHEFLSTRC